jgi:hypothetical protein
MNKNILASAGIGAVMALATSVQAQDLTVSTSATTAWLGSPVYQTGAGPTTDSGGTTQDNNSWGGNANGSGGFGALAQMFTVTSAGTLANVQMVFAGSPANFNVELYDMGATPGGYQAPSGSTPTITQINNIGSGTATGSPPTLTGGVNLLQAGDNIAFAGVGSGQTLLTLTLGGSDSSVHLATGELYVLTLDPTGANADNTWWRAVVFRWRLTTPARVWPRMAWLA